jgi:hypothetical protein
MDWYSAEMPSDDAAGDDVGELCHRRASVGPDDELRSFHLDLKAKPAGGEPQDFLKPGHCEVHGPHLCHRGDLGQGQDESGREFPGCCERGHEQVQGAQAAGPGGRFEALEADADERRRCSGRNCCGNSVGGSNGVGVFCLIAAVPVAVFEVQTEVFDGFGGQLGCNACGNSGREVGLLAQQLTELFEATVGLRRRECLGAPVRNEGGREAVGRDVDGVDGLAGAVVAGVVAVKQLVRGGELVLDVGQIGCRE